MSLTRIVRHLCMTPWRMRRAFPPATLAAIERAIARSEQAQSGQIRFAVEGALHGSRLYRGQSARERALEVFSHLRMWDTEHRNGLLIYLLLADRAVEIVVDRGAHARVESAEWRRICRDMEAQLRAGRYAQSVVQGIEAITPLLAAHFPATADHGRGLPDVPVVL